MRGQLHGAAAPGTRLSKEARREQLLDVAAELLLERGIASLTMERLAEYAGVSKALPYSHFDNADEVSIALHLQEILHMGGAISAAQVAGGSPEIRLAAAVHAYFDVVKERGAILAIVMSPAVTHLVPASANDTAREFVVDLLTETMGLRGKAAVVLGEVIPGALAGAVSAWARGEVSRAMAERVATAFIIAGVRDALAR